MKKILITGGGGFIGTHLVSRLSQMAFVEITVLDIAPPHFIRLPEHVRFIQGDLRDANLLRKIIADDSIEMIYHLAWGTIHETATRDPLADVNVNVHASLTLFDVCVQSNVNHIVYLSSGGTVYGVPEILPICESHPTNPINAYGISKLTVEKYLQMYAHLHAIDYTIFRPSVPYGPFQNPNRRQGAVTVFTYHALTGKPIHIWGTGDTIRDYFYIDDLIDALIAPLTVSASKNKIYNLSGNHPYTLNDLVGMIKKNLRLDPIIEYDEKRKIDVGEIILDSASASLDLGWSPRIGLEEGIQRTAEWLKAAFLSKD